ncbi:MAG: DUF262 domain-containing protein [Mesorhizobium sp.]|nr:MAG: DUF262 domain-containing protein [Mesorhizobium sp.]
MPYSAATVAETVMNINRRYFLPAIQRPYVWNSEQIVRLFDSLMKGFPISSFLFWDVATENKQNWQTYRFAENFRQGEIHNEHANLDGLDATLVLDGQQRLTSLLIGLRGSLTEKVKHKRNTSVDAWRTKKLYLDLLVEPDDVFDEDDEEHDEELYAFEFRETPPPHLPGQLWIRVGEILEHRDYASFETFKAKKLGLLRLDAPKAEREIAARNLDRLHCMVWQDESVSFYTEKLQDYDRVLRIFVRANDAGTKLSKSDLMMSMISSRWSQFSAREEIVNLVHEINSEGTRRNAITRDYVIKAALLLSGLNHQYQVRNLTLANIDSMQSAWPKVKKSLRATFALLNTYGLDETNLTSLNATLPIAQYLHLTGHDLLTQDTPFNVVNAERIRRWIIAALINTVFGGASDSTITVARNVIEKSKPGSDFPFLQLHAELSKHLRRSSAFEDSTIDDVLKLTYGKKLTFLALTLLYDEHRWGNIPHHVDHVFPHAVLSRNALMGLNVSQSKIDELRDLENRFANLELLSAPENLEKNAQQFSTWIRTRDVGFISRHRIPEGEHLQTVLMLPKFIEEREKLIRKRLRRLQLDPASGNAD